MGRPLLSTLVAPVAPAVRVAEPDVKSPTYERWSYVNQFDPDADDFFEGDDVVYEAFLTPEEIAERENMSARVRVEISSTLPAQSTIRSRLLRAAQANGVIEPEPDMDGEDQRGVFDLPIPLPALDISYPSEDSSSGSSDATSSGRTSPAETDELLDASAARRAEIDVEWGTPYDPTELENMPPSPLSVSTQSLARSLPSTPIRASYLADAYTAPVFAHAQEIPPPSTAPVDIPASPMPHPAQAVASPMTPPGSVTPRFLTWGGGSSRPRAIDMSPSPTPASPFGSARVARLAYISPPVLRVQQ